MAADEHTVEGLRAARRAAEAANAQWDPVRFGGWLYAFEVTGVRLLARGPAGDTPLVLVKVGKSTAFHLGKRLDGELGGANDALLERLRADGSPRNLSAHGIAAIDNLPPSHIFFAPADIGFEEAHGRAFGLTFADLVYLPLARPTIDAERAAAYALALPDEPVGLAAHPDGDTLFVDALKALDKLRTVDIRLSEARMAKRDAWFAAALAYLDAARDPAPISRVTLAAARADFVNRAGSNLERGKEAVAVVLDWARTARPLIKQRMARTRVLAARALADAHATNPALHPDAAKFVLPAKGPLSWASILGATSARGLGPTELVAAAPERVAAVRVGGPAVLRNVPNTAPRPERVVLVDAAGAEHEFVAAVIA